MLTQRAKLLNLQLMGIDNKRMVINVKAGKGRKDRVTVLGQTVLDELRQYYKAYKPRKYLFEGANGEKYSTTSVVNIIKASTKRAGIQKKVTLHILRHSFATHLPENDVSLRYIQSLLDYNSSRTTEIYTRVAVDHYKKIKNLLD